MWNDETDKWMRRILSGALVAIIIGGLALVNWLLPTVEQVK